LDTARLANY